MGLLKNKRRKPLMKCKSPALADLVKRMDDERVYSIHHDNGRPAMYGIRMKGKQWKEFVGSYKKPSDSDSIRP